MSSTAGAAVLLIILATLIVVAFVVLWTRDKSRADEESTDPSRTAPDPNAEARRDSFAPTPPTQSEGGDGRPPIS